MVKQVSKQENKSRRVIQPVVLVSAPERVTVKTRLRPDHTDEVVLRELGKWYERELLWVFKQVNALKRKPSMSDKKHLKRELIKRGMSARWANALIIEATQAYNSARASQERYLVSLRTRIERISKRLSTREQEKDDNNSSRVKPYKPHERQGKNQRLQALQAEEKKVTMQLITGYVSYTRGGKKLLHNRLHLDTSGKTLKEWQEEWRATRRQVKVPGEAGKNQGNEVLRVLNNGTVEVQLPEALKHLSNVVTSGKHARYQFSAPVNFNHRAQELLIAQDNQSAVAHSLTYNAQKQRYYLTATYQALSNKRSGSVQSVIRKSSGVLGVDLNKSHIAARRVDKKGNPIGKPERLAFNLEGSTTRRDAQLRNSISKLLKICQQENLVLVIEDLDFTSSKTLGRENENTSKSFRHMIHGFPTTKFASRLTSMSTTAGVSVIAVDPAYTSKMGKQYWLSYLGRQANVHDAAAIMIARRGLNLKLKRRNNTKYKSNTLKNKKTNHNLKKKNKRKNNLNGSLGSLLKPAGNQRIENKLSSTVPSGTDTGSNNTNEPLPPSSLLIEPDLNEVKLFKPGSISNELDSSRPCGIVAPSSSNGDAQDE